MENKFSEGLTKVFKQSKSEAKRLHSEFLSTEHFLLGIIQTDNSAKEILESSVIIGNSVGAARISTFKEFSKEV